eukprot:CAMPEP_0114225116 /NCGR_PEP_ID=MMETSP0058-20121206/483_1 /TAXON_ID=36894 /ORGANISM="Pyramimonas parkeae, CCMP726" /LENGTH=638 /DNA_ID=CAMNT_0001335665 /DNA_START=534 /DNA_END=2450 /DNA_ORIENTATION=+
MKERRESFDSETAEVKATERDETFWAVEANQLSARQVQAKVKHLTRKGQTSAACALLRAALDMEPNNLFHLTTLGSLEAKRGRLSRGRECFQRAASVGGSASSVTLQAWALLETKAGKFSRARELFGEAVKADPRHAPAWQAWAIMERDQGQLDRARCYFKKAVAADESHTPSKQAWALLEARAGETETARQLFQSAVDAQPDHIPSWQAWAEMEWGCGNRKRSRQLYKQGMQCAMAQVKQQKRQQMKTQQQQRQSPPRRRQPFLGCLLTSWGSSEAEIGNSKTGMQLLRTAVDADPFNAQAWLMWARWVEDRGTITALEQAQEIVNVGLRHCPGNQQLMHTRAMLLLHLKKREEARAILQDLLKSDHLNAHALHTLGLMAQVDAEPQTALKFFKEGALYGHRGSAKAKCYGAWALYLTTLQQIDEAREMYRKGDEVFPGYGTHLRHWALFEKKHGSKEDARDLFEQAAEANPEDYRTWLQWGLWERANRNMEAARTCFNRGLCARPVNPFCWLSLALLEAATGEMSTARDVFERATRKCKRVALLWMEFALFEARVGNLDRARELFSIGSSISPAHLPLFEAWALFEIHNGEQERANKILTRLEVLGYSLSSFLHEDLSEVVRSRSGGMTRPHETCV